jgi:HAD superfamily hydrolase (TIGR01509 family)
MEVIMIRAVFFDFDGLVLDTAYPEFLSWQETFQEHGCSLALETWVAHTGTGASNIGFSPYEALEALLERKIDREVIRAARRQRFAALMATERILPGVEARLREARELGLNVAVVSSSSREWVTGYLDRFGLVSAFDATFCADDVRRTKPDPELYLLALAALGVGAEQAFVLEDSANGVAAAKQAGIFCIAIPNRLTRHSCLDQADLIVHSLAEVTLRQLMDDLAAHRSS